jgi:hypothetical protein
MPYNGLNQREEICTTRGAYKDYLAANYPDATIVSMPYNGLNQQQCLSPSFPLFYHFLLKNQRFSFKKWVSLFFSALQEVLILCALADLSTFFLILDLG